MKWGVWFLFRELLGKTVGATRPKGMCLHPVSGRKQPLKPHNLGINPYVKDPCERRVEICLIQYHMVEGVERDCFDISNNARDSLEMSWSLSVCNLWEHFHLLGREFLCIEETRDSSRELNH